MKKLNYLIFTLFAFIIFNTSVSAGSLSIWANANSVKVGSTVTISVQANNLAGSFDITSSNNGVLSGGATGVWLELNTYTYTFTAKSAGTATITARAVDASDTEGAGGTFSGSKSVTITVVNPSSGGSSSGGSSSGSSSGGGSRNSSGSGYGTTADKKKYSSNNYLKELSIKDFDLNLKFDKDTLEYNVEVPNDTEIVNVNATAEDENASVNGTGEVKVTEGDNKIEIKVTAENGNEKIYVVNVKVKELDPIYVTIGKEKYTIIRKEGSLEIPENYEKSTIKINNEDVLCYKNIVTGNIIIGLKDSKGNEKFYSYNQKKKKYTLYNGYKIGGLNLNILSMPKKKLPKGYEKVSFDYDKNKLFGYQYMNKHVTYAADETVKGSDFYLFYAVNELTGKKGLYVYDKLENTVQRYNNSDAKKYQDKSERYFLYLIILGVVLAITIITFTLILIKKGKHKTRFA